MEIIKQFSSVPVWLYESHSYNIYIRSILTANSEEAPSGEGVLGDLPLQWFCPNGISLGSHLCPDGDHSSLLSLSERHCVGECRLRLLAVNTEQVCTNCPRSPGYKEAEESGPWGLSTFIGHSRGPPMEVGGSYLPVKQSLFRKGSVHWPSVLLVLSASCFLT